MLARELKLSSPAQFSRTIKRGFRVGSRTVVIHLQDTTGDEVATSGGPRFGLIVSKAVGNAVIRHRTSRRLRHICAAIAETLKPSTDIVIRVLPAAGQAESQELEADITRCLKRISAKQKAKNQ